MKFFSTTAVILACVGMFYYAITTMPQQRDILHALRAAKTVNILEYRKGPAQGGYDGLLTSKTLTDDQRKELLKAFTPHGWHETPQGVFDPHHRIECLMPDGSTHFIDLSFDHGEYAVDKGANTGFGPWCGTLRETLPRLGFPVRSPEFYHGP